MQDPPHSSKLDDDAAHVQGLFVRHQLELRGMLPAILGDFSAVDDVLRERAIRTPSSTTAIGPR